MKSFNQHVDKKSENLQEDPFDDLTDLLWVGAAGAGIWGLSKGWDKFGKDAVASLPFAPDKWKAAKIDRKKEKDDEKEKIAKTLAGPDDTEKAQAKLDKDKKKKDDASTKADAAMVGKKRDSEGNLAKQKDAQQSKDISGTAPPGWITSQGKPGSPSEGDVWKKGDYDKWMEKRKADTEKKLGARKTKKAASQAAKDDDVGARLGFDKGPKPGEVETGSYIHTAKAELKEFEEKDRNEILENLVLGGSMTITESNELQAIMALDDVGIKAEINRKGQVVIKKKDKKKAQIALEKSFKKGGWPTLKLEDVEIDQADELINYVEMKMSAAAKKKKALWAKSSGGKKSLLKSKKRAKKVSSGAIKIDKARGRSMAKARKKGGIRNEFEIDEASSKKARNTAADAIEAIADKGGAEAPALFSLASKLRKGTHSTTGLKLSKKVTSILKDNGIKEEVQKPRTAYDLVSEARKRAATNKPNWEPEDSEPRLS